MHKEYIIALWCFTLFVSPICWSLFETHFFTDTKSISMLWCIPLFIGGGLFYSLPTLLFLKLISFLFSYKEYSIFFYKVCTSIIGSICILFTFKWIGGTLANTLIVTYILVYVIGVFIIRPHKTNTSKPSL